MTIKQRNILHKTTKLSLGLAFGLALMMGSTHAAELYKTINYFPVSGTTREELDLSLEKNGPSLDGSTVRHPAATTLSFDPQITIYKKNGYCVIHTVNVNLYAKMHLPEWTERATTHSIELARFWDVLSQDIIRHEEDHIMIAYNSAVKMEKTINNLKKEKSCTELQENIRNASHAILAEHDKEQEKFDDKELKNYKKRLNSLLSKANAQIIQ